MASIITATTSSGLTQSADLSGVLQLASGTGNLVTIPSVTGTAMVSGNMPAFGVWLSSAQNITSSTFTKIDFDTEEFDTNNNFASGRFTPTVAGYYQLSVGMYFNSSSSCTRALFSIYKNGTAFKNGNYMPPITSDSLRGIAVGSSLVYANGSTDYFEIYGFITATSPYFDGGQNQVYFNGFLARTA
jgi:hypothetical protein